MAKTRFGVMVCEGQECESHDRGAPVVVFKNEHETLSYSCDWCGRSPYARPGTGQYKEWERAMQRMGGPVASEPAPNTGLNINPVQGEQSKPEEEKKSSGSAGLLIE